jgi:hypothetical protein
VTEADAIESITATWAKSFQLSAREVDQPVFQP